MPRSKIAYPDYGNVVISCVVVVIVVDSNPFEIDPQLTLVYVVLVFLVLAQECVVETCGGVLRSARKSYCN